MESRRNAAVLDASTGSANQSLLETVHVNPYSKPHSLPANFIVPFFDRFATLPAAQSPTPIIPTGSQK